jgi:hypothetical protein
MTTYYKSRPSGYHGLFLAGAVVRSDDDATLHYYGTITLRQPLPGDECESLGLTLADDDARDREAEAGALYRAETRHFQ